MSTEIPIWVNGEIRWLSGIDKKTTCKDIVEVLLDAEGISKSEVKDFTIMERWRKVERPLDENSKILKIWSHWGYEKKEVRLCLRRIDNEVDSGRGSPIGSGSTPSFRRKKNRFRANGKPPWIHPEALHPRRLAELDRFGTRDYDDYYVRNPKSTEINEDSSNQNYGCDIYGNSEIVNCRKKSSQKSYQCPSTGRLHSTLISDCSNPKNRTKKTSKCCSKRGESKQKTRNSENIEKLMKLILAQGATIQSQLQKLKERDEQIESIEQERHRERLEKNGRNYLLETYLGSLKEAEIPAEMDEERADDSGVNTEVGSDQMNAMKQKNQESSDKNETELLEANDKSVGRRLGHQVHHRSEESATRHSSNGSCHKNARSKSESRTHESKSPELNLKRTLSDNSLANTSARTKSNDADYDINDRNGNDDGGGGGDGDENDGGKRVQPADDLNTKEESEEVIELKKIQSQIQMWEKVFKINKKLEKEEETLVRLHIKVKKYQNENYRFAKENNYSEAMDKEQGSSNEIAPVSRNDHFDQTDSEQNYLKMKRNLESLKSDLEQNSKEIYRNFTKLLEEDEKVERKRISLTKLMSDLERTEIEGDALNEMMAASRNGNGKTSTDCQQISYGAENDSVSKTPEVEVCSSGYPTGEGATLQMNENSPQSVGGISEINQSPEGEDFAREKFQRIPPTSKPKMVKISFEDEIRRCENFGESGQEKISQGVKEPIPVTAGALKGILKNRMKQFSNNSRNESENNDSNDDSQSRLKFTPNRVEPKNFYSNHDGTENDFSRINNFSLDGDVPEPNNNNNNNNNFEGFKNPCGTFGRTCSRYLLESNRNYFSPPQLPNNFDLKTAFSAKISTHPNENSMRKSHPNVVHFPQSTTVKTKVSSILNDNDSSTSSDTSGLCSMYSSSPSVEQPYIEHGYILDTLV